MLIFENGIEHKKKIELKTALLDAERTRRPVKFYTRNRVMIDQFRCRDTENKPFTLESFTCHGGLIYYKLGRFEWRTISIDDVLKIEIA